MKKTLLATVSVIALLKASPVYAQGAAVNLNCPLSGGGWTVCNAGNPQPVEVENSITASLGGYQPSGNYSTPLSASTVSSAVALPSGSPTTIAVYNTGTQAAYCKLVTSGGAATTSDDLVPGNSAVGFTVGANTSIACITSTGTTTINIGGGSGLLTGFGGGGSSGGGGSNGAAGPTGSAVPSDGSYNALNVGGTLRGQTGVNPAGSVYDAQTDISSLNGTSLGSPSNYGTAPSGEVIGVNANITNNASVSVSNVPTVNQGNTAASVAWLMNMGAMGGTSISSSCVQFYGTAPGSSVACPSVNAYVTGAVGLAQGSTTSGQTGSLIMGATQQYVTPTIYTTAETNPFSLDLAGNVRETPQASSGKISGNNSTAGTGTVSLVSLVSGERLYIQALSCSNSGGTATEVTLQDGSGGSTLWSIQVPAGGGNNIASPAPLFWTTAGNALYFVSSASTSTLYCNASGYAGG